MSARLAHRGPDGAGVHVDGRLGLVHRRLAILDLSEAGSQPMSNEDGSVWVVYNGQLYGFEPLRHRLEQRGHRFRSRTDTEVLVHLYEELGDAMLDAIDGMFAFALWDARRRRLLLARDRLGIKPLHFVESQGRLAFASELRALLALPWVSREPDPNGLALYLYQSSVPGTASILKGVRKLQPGERLVADDDGVRLETWWRPPAERDLPSPPTLAVAARELDARLGEAVRSHLVADVPVGAFLSGGLDSAAVTLHARRALDGPFHTFSVRFEGTPWDDEGPAARQTAQALGTTHHELRVGPESFASLADFVRAGDEPFAITSGLALLQLARFARQTVKVVLTGDGADELLGGYPWRHHPELGRGATPVSFARGVAMAAVRSRRGALAGGPGTLRQLGSRLPRMLRRPAERYAEIASAFVPEELEDLLCDDLRPLAREAWQTHPIRCRYAEQVAGDPVNRRLRADLATTLVDEMLAKVDRMTMASGLEARVPFLDRGFVEWALGVPGRYKLRGATGKLPLRAALRDPLPATAGRAKHGFDMPLAAWLRGPLRGWVEEPLSQAAVRARGLFRPEAVESLLRAHRDGRGNHSRRIFTLLALEMWLRDLRA